jgi:nicotinate-nucleotide adenylyltransferase
LASLALFGGAFDPPHDGHVALVRAAKDALGLDRVIVLVAAAPAHKDVRTPAGIRLELARAAFPDDDVLLDEHPRTVDTLRAHPEWADPVFLVGADEFAQFLSWKEPDEILRLARLGVFARSGSPRDRAEGVLAKLERPERVRFFELAEPAASRELRARFGPNPPVPAAVAAIIERERLYSRPPGYTGAA